ncbi:MAG TPA: MaoC family dehydratase N-terminal domain-containing protein [Acidimicrobiales bacterium]|nr:MaoC family dehydratase N-terminal domain-containing protein [Acidimicrobiales bacterium]
MAEQRFPVEASHILMFARAIGDPNPAYSDPDSPEAKAAGGIVAPPTFSMASWQFQDEHPLRPDPAKPWFGSGKEPTGRVSSGGGGGGGGGGGLHAEQHFEYHQPLRPGMVLIATTKPGKTWEKESRRGGTLKFSENVTEYRDESTGELVVTARGVGVRTERPVSKEA